jgi:hypothetical protein
VYESALPGVAVTWLRLHADAAELARRVGLRAAGHGWAEPGDPLRRLPLARQREVAAAAAAAAATRRLDCSGLRALRVGTSALTISAAADAVLARWLRHRAAHDAGSPAKG